MIPRGRRERKRKKRERWKSVRWKDGHKVSARAGETSRLLHSKKTSISSEQRRLRFQVEYFMWLQHNSSVIAVLSLQKVRDLHRCTVCTDFFWEKMEESFFSDEVYCYLEAELGGRHPPTPYTLSAPQESCQNTGDFH